MWGLPGQALSPARHPQLVCTLTTITPSVPRFVKYTGYGNAAGLLAARGLMAGGRPPGQYSEDEDTDTDEYKEAKARCVPHPQVPLSAPAHGHLDPGRRDSVTRGEAFGSLALFPSDVEQCLLENRLKGPRQLGDWVARVSGAD